MRVSEALELVDGEKGREFRCFRCSRSLGPSNENYKLSTIMDESPVGTANPYIIDPQRHIKERIVLRRYYCPGCGVILDTDVSRAEEPPLWDIQIS
jgi:N-methylhydantoinase B